MANRRLIVVLVVALLLAVGAVIYAETLGGRPAATGAQHHSGRFRIYQNPGGTLVQTFLLDVQTGDAWQVVQTVKGSDPLEGHLAWRKMPKD